jgi:glutathione S-transferase
VPVLILPTGSVLEQSLDIMLWAMTTHSLSSPLQADLPAVLALIQTNDGTFKAALDGYKYADTLQNRGQHQAQAQIFLQQLESRLQTHRYLFADEMTIADLAIFPFVRQCAAVDANWFASLPYVALQTWLHHWEQSALFQSVMQKHPLWNDPII